ncbi:MAG: hypothetical protein WCG28_04085 [bacterium]
MSKRNLVLIIIVLIIVTGIAFAFLYFYKPTVIGNIETTSVDFISNFFPFGKSKTNTTGEGTPPADVSGYTPPTTPQTPREILIKVSSMPIAGYGVFMKERFKEEMEKPQPPVETPPVVETNPVDNSTPTSSKIKNKAAPVVVPTPPTTEFIPALHYVERATGNIYQTFADKIDERKFTTTIIPQVYDAYIGENGESAVMRYLKPDGKTIATFAGITPKEILGGDTSLLSEVRGSFLPENITDISLSPDGLSMFYLFDIENSAVGVIASSSGDKKNQIFSSPFTEWLSQWPNERMLTLTTKPSFGTEGFMYSIDPTVKKLTKVLSGIKGLATLTSPSGKLVLYNNNNLSLRVYNIDTKDSMSLGIKTMPEKCVWNTTSTTLYCAVPKYIDGTNYPDIWYQGETSFSDNLWKVNIETGSTTMLADPTSFTKGEEVDGIKLSLDSGENYLFFVNKKDSFLWELNLK